ncbi:MAG: multicopper oxidase domain-containing protein [Thermodesulfovibrionales bacterium]
MEINRRNFLKGMGALVIGTSMPWIFEDKAFGAVQVQSLDFHITDAMKEMVTHNSINDARCYFWIYKDSRFPAECPGPIIFTTEGDSIQITLTNDLNEPHSLYIPGAFNSGPIAPAASATFTFKAPKAGTYLYYDNLNAPVNRVMGLHGAFIVMPRRRWKGHKFTPYSQPTLAVQQIYDDFGTAHFPGLAWEQGVGDVSDPNHAHPFRQYIWLCHQASPILFAEVGNYTSGADYPAADFVNFFLNDPYADTFNNPGNVLNKKAHFFTLNGQSGFFGHHNPFIAPNHRVGEPVLIRVLNAGLHSHSMHIHANHAYVTGINNVPQVNPLWVDTFTSFPMETFEYTLPFQRPPDIPNQRGIGMPDAPLMCIENPLIPGSTPHPVWPPTEEMDMHFPAIGTLADPANPASVDISVQMSPLCYPMHDHSEASQSAQGGNYNCGLISGLDFIGDRTLPGGVVTFPNAATTHNPSETGPAAPPVHME